MQLSYLYIQILSPFQVRLKSIDHKVVYSFFSMNLILKNFEIIWELRNKLKRWLIVQRLKLLHSNQNMFELPSSKPNSFKHLETFFRFKNKYQETIGKPGKKIFICFQ